MTISEPEVVAWSWAYRGRHMATTDYSQALELAEPPYPTEVEPLIRLADYQRLQADHERLQAECEKLRSIISDLKGWDCDVSGGFLSIPVDLRSRMQEAIVGAMQRAKP